MGVYDEAVRARLSSDIAAKKEAAAPQSRDGDGALASTPAAVSERTIGEEAVALQREYSEQAAHQKVVLEELVEVGFDEEDAKKAATANGWRFKDAVHALLNNERQQA